MSLTNTYRDFHHSLGKAQEELYEIAREMESNARILEDNINDTGVPPGVANGLFRYIQFFENLSNSIERARDGAEVMARDMEQDLKFFDLWD